MVIYIAVISLVNIVIGFALAAYLASQHRSLIPDRTVPAAIAVSAEALDSIQPTGGAASLGYGTEEPGESSTNPESVPTAEVFGNLEPQVLAEQRSKDGEFSGETEEREVK